MVSVAVDPVTMKPSGSSTFRVDSSQVKNDVGKNFIPESYRVDATRRGSEKQLDEDYDRLRQKQIYPSQDDPDNVFLYKKMRLIPESDADFKGLVDKDVVLANVKKKLPDPDYNKLMTETIAIFKKIFVVAKDVFVTDREGKLIPKFLGGKQVGWETERVFLFDSNFEPVIEFLVAGFKYEHVASRAMGDDRESVLDRTTKLEKGVKRSEIREGV